MKAAAHADFFTRLIVVALAFGPALVIGGVLASIGLKRSSPRIAPIALAAGVGSALVCFVAIALLPFINGFSLGLSRNIASAFIGAAIPEETSKLVFLTMFVLTQRDADVRRDAIFFGALVGMGFAAYENFLYVSSARDWLAFGAPPPALAVPGHVAWGLIMGACLARGMTNRAWLPFAWLLPILLHGLYNTSVSGLTGDVSKLVTGDTLGYVLGLVVVLAAVLALIVRLVAPAWARAQTLPPARDTDVATAERAALAGRLSILALLLISAVAVLGAAGLAAFHTPSLALLAALAIPPWSFVELWRRT
jgi:RsiW-degrading membrane proteinase PrsW (M82 family)